MLKEAGRMKTIKRTEGVSTTHLVGRILTTPENLVDEIKRTFAAQSLIDADGKTASPISPNGSAIDSDAPLPSPDASSQLPPSAISVTTGSVNGTANGHAAAPSPAPGSLATTRKGSHSPASRSPFLPTSSFFPTSYRISQFGNHRTPSPSDHVVYVDGDFDLFHAGMSVFFKPSFHSVVALPMFGCLFVLGHVQYLEKARALGSFLFVGIHDDPSTYNVRGGNFPIMALHERVLNVLACRWVDEVIIGAPW
jgi:cytidyltransferase-like protein